MQFLAYYWATDMLQVEVVNGNEKGSDLETIKSYTNIMKQKLSHIHKDSKICSDSLITIKDKLFPNKMNFVFLDHSNGDFYWLDRNWQNANENYIDDTISSMNNKGNYWCFYFL